MCEVRRNRFSDEKAFEGRDEGFFSHARVRERSKPACYHTHLLRIARRYVIGGRVQGVGFRYFTQAAAEREGVHGWVRNRPDGSVEASAEGESESIDRFERSIRHGPPGARVEQVEVEHLVPEGRSTGFSIK